MTNQNNTWTVYIHTCNVNQKSYVGITSKPPNIRWKNGEGYKTQVFYRAIQKYGWDNFTHKIIATNLTEQEAKQVLESMLNQMEWMPKTESKDILRDALRIAIEKLDVH